MRHGGLVLGALWAAGCGGSPPPLPPTDLAVIAPDGGPGDDLAAGAGDLAVPADLASDLKVPFDLTRGDLAGPPLFSFTLEPSGVTQDLKDVWGTSAADIWAVGAGGTIVHRDGSGWSRVASATVQDLNGVWAAAPNDAWAVGAGGTLLHWDGAAWSALASGTTRDLHTISGYAADRVYAGGEAGVLLAWDGARWSAAASGITSAVMSLYPSGPRQLYLGTAEYSQSPGPMNHHGYAMRFVDLDTGTGTNRYLVPDKASSMFSAMHGSGPDNIWAVGVEGTTGAGCSYNGLTYHLRAGAWDKGCFVSPPMSDVWTAGPADAWLAMNSTEVLRWSGNSYVGPLPSYRIPTAAPHPLIGVWGSGPGAAPAWFVGQAGTILRAQ